MQIRTNKHTNICVSSLNFFSLEEWLNHPIWTRIEQARANLLFVTVTLEHRFTCFDKTKTATRKRKSILGSPKPYTDFSLFGPIWSYWHSCHDAANHMTNFIFLSHFTAVVCAYEWTWMNQWKIWQKVGLKERAWVNSRTHNLNWRS